MLQTGTPGSQASSSKLQYAARSRFLPKSAKPAASRIFGSVGALPRPDCAIEQRPDDDAGSAGRRKARYVLRTTQKPCWLWATHADTPLELACRKCHTAGWIRSLCLPFDGLSGKSEERRRTGPAFQIGIFR